MIWMIWWLRRHTAKLKSDDNNLYAYIERNIAVDKDLNSESVTKIVFTIKQSKNAIKH